MKITLELPGALVREIKLRAVHEGRELGDVAEQVFRRGLALRTPPKRAGSRTKLPLIKCRHEAAASDELTPERVAELLLKQGIEAADESARG